MGLVEIAGELATKFGERAEIHEQQGTFPFENYADLRQSGYLSATIPVELGGLAANLPEVTRAQIALGQGCGSTALVAAMHLAQTARLQFTGCPAPLAEKIMRGIVANGYLANSVQSEPATGSPSRGGLPTTTARPTEGGYILNGRKTYTTGAPILRYMVVTATLTTADASPVIGYFLVEQTGQDPAVQIDETWNMLAMRLSGSHDLVLNEAFVSAENLVGLGKQMTPPVAAQNAAWGLPVAAVYLGIGRAAANFAAHYARNRRPNSLGDSIATLYHIQEKAGQMELALLSAENTLLATADLAVSAEAERNPARLTALIGAAKQLATNQAIVAVDLALRIVGSSGLAMELPLQRYYRDVRAGLGNPPMDDVSTIMLGKLALGLLEEK